MPRGVVVDAGASSLYDVSTVHVTVTDDNDNTPVFTHPSTTDNDTAVIQLTSSVHVGHVVTQVRATDADIDVNARLSYSIINDVSGNIELFSIDEESGEVRVARSLPRTSGDVTYHLVIAVSDAGTARLTSQTAVDIVVSEAESESRDVDVVSRRSALYSTSRLVDMTWWLVAGGCAAAGLLVLLCTLCLLVGVNKQRRRKRRTRSNATTSTTTTAPRTASLSRRKIQPPPPLALMTDIDPLTSAMLRRHQLDDVTVLGQPAGLEGGNYVNYLQNTAVCGDISCKSAPVSRPMSSLIAMFYMSAVYFMSVWLTFVSVCLYMYVCLSVSELSLSQIRGFTPSPAARNG